MRKAGVRKVVSALHEQCPQAKVVLMAIFPRGEQLNQMRGDVLQVNQALMADAALGVTVAGVPGWLGLALSKVRQAKKNGKSRKSQENRRFIHA